jgi:hypothetical protein
VIGFRTGICNIDSKPFFFQALPDGALQWFVIFDQKESHGRARFLCR